MTVSHCPRGSRVLLIKMIVKRFANSGAAHNGGFSPTEQLQSPQGSARSLAVLGRRALCSSVSWVDAAAAGQPGAGPCACCWQPASHSTRRSLCVSSAGSARCQGPVTLQDSGAEGGRAAESWRVSLREVV